MSCAPHVSSVIWTGLLPTIMTSSFQSIANRQEWELSYLVATSGDDLISVSAGSEAEVQLVSGHDARLKGQPCLHHKVVGNGRSRQNLLKRQARFRLLRVTDMEPGEALHPAFRAPVDRDETKTEEDQRFLERPTTARLSQNSAALFPSGHGKLTL